MLIRFNVTDRYYAFHENDVPSGCYRVYVKGSPMYNFLNRILNPSMISHVRVETDGANCYCVIEFLFDDLDIRLPFEQISDDLPF